MFYYVYMLRCADNSIYTGYTTNLARREKEHNQKKGSKAIRGRLPCRLTYYEVYKDKVSATRREYFLKCMNKKQKECLILVGLLIRRQGKL